MSIKQQLREFYQNQGLKPHEMRKAIRYDMRSIRKQPLGLPNPVNLMQALSWKDSAEGVGYWLSRSVGRPCSLDYSRGPRRTIR